MAFLLLIIGLALLAWGADEAWWLHALIYTDKGNRMYQAKRQWLLIDFGEEEYVKTEIVRTIAVMLLAIILGLGTVIMAVGMFTS